MQLPEIHPNNQQPRRGIASVAGLALIATGLVVLAEQTFKTGWLILVALPLIGVVFFASLVRQQRLGLTIPGSLVLTIGIGLLLALKVFAKAGWAVQFGFILLVFSFGWALITIVTHFVGSKDVLWPLIPAGAIFSLGASFFWGDLSLISFVFFIVTGFGLVFLLTGIYTRLFGLILTGALLVGIGPGVYFGWNQNAGPNALAQTGIMLVWFSLGWGILTVLNRALFHKFIWWPLIPGGILGMVGWGLYIGGNPGNALSFIGNTGSIGLIIFGAYLLLMKRGLHQ
ncbi:hypothetical protein LARV_02438 [Longilinea arvoryzae]|uniref:DUF2157 domain-containing protein n=1 Tax=Longilinea arvoryzae TaxID=360412 RepID=A0A0S7BK08_9CHLR|nr:hypothetical protein [Longilinea arvoryzae]GAP14664.1 hypothetical protein LARV_02438 [Longilinea arvoryzae]